MVLDEVGCIDGAVVRDMLIDELCQVVLIQIHHVHYRDGCCGGEGIIGRMYFMYLRRTMEIPSHHKLPTPRQSASNNSESNILNVIWRNIQGEEPDRKFS
jgi:hypothetical protein